MNIPKIKIAQKPNYIKFAEDVDFYSLFEKIEAHFSTCFIFESLGEEGRFSRYSVIGFDPKHVIRAKGKKLFIDEKDYTVDNPYAILQDIMPQNAIARSYAGGLVGYLSYDAINYFEPSLSVKTHDHFDQFCFGVYTDGLIFDKVTNELFYFYYDVNRLEDIKHIEKQIVRNRRLKISSVKNRMSKQQQKTIVEKVKEEISAGNTFQVQIGFPYEFVISGNALPIYKRLRRVNPSPFMYYISFGKKKIIGSSPELLFRVQDGEMATYPLAGTIKRGKTQQEDKQLARQLLSDQKEIAEHNMLVDLHRNDIGRVAQFGTVKVRSLMDIKRFSHVQHIGSEVVGIMKSNEDMFSALSSNFPAGTLSGAPKIESIKIIDRLENRPRGPYGGAVGHFGFNGDCTFAIAIRTVFIDDKYGFTQGASGIVYDSKPEKEYDEVERKLAAMKEVLKS